MILDHYILLFWKSLQYSSVTLSNNIGWRISNELCFLRWPVNLLGWDRRASLSCKAFSWPNPIRNFLTPIAAKLSIRALSFLADKKRLLKFNQVLKIKFYKKRKVFFGKKNCSQFLQIHHNPRIARRKIHQVSSDRGCWKIAPLKHFQSGNDR